VLSELIKARYEHRSILITANQPSESGNKVFPDTAMTLSAVDLLVHHATIFEMNVFPLEVSEEAIWAVGQVK
jgi:DNA replication protein DnaC